MISLKSTSAALALSVILAACGGGGSTGAAPSDEAAPSQASQPAEAKQAPTSITFIGNSITILDDWGRGAAASAIQFDYVHLTATALGLPFSATNFASLEHNPTDAFNHVDMTTPVGQQIGAVTNGINSTTAVVVELGDNALIFDEFAANYAQLLAYVKGANRFVCVSTWWGNGEKDKIIKSACEAAGGTYIYIGDIYTDPGNRDAIDGPQYADIGVQAHPHDWSMAKIAGRVTAALR